MSELGIIATVRYGTLQHTNSAIPNQTSVINQLLPENSHGLALFNVR